MAHPMAMVEPVEGSRVNGEAALTTIRPSPAASAAPRRQRTTTSREGHGDRCDGGGYRGAVNSSSNGFRSLGSGPSARSSPARKGDMVAASGRLTKCGMDRPGRG